MQRILAKVVEAVYEELVNQVRDNLTPDLLQPRFRDAPFPMGHCYVASEAIYHLLGGKSSGLTPYRLRMPDGVVHWWLQTPDGEVIDPTHDQFDHSIPYAEGKAGGFLTREPSKRAQELMSRVSKTSQIIPVTGLGAHDNYDDGRRTFIYVIPTDHLYLADNNGYHNEMFMHIYQYAPEDMALINADNSNVALGFIERNYEDHALEVRNYYAEGEKLPDNAIHQLENYFGERIYQRDWEYPVDWTKVDDMPEPDDYWSGSPTKQWPESADDQPFAYGSPLKGYEQQRESAFQKQSFDNSFVYTEDGHLYIENRPHPQILREHDVTQPFIAGIMMENDDKLYITFFSWSQFENDEQEDPELQDRARQAIEYETGKFPVEVSYDEMHDIDVAEGGMGHRHADRNRMDQRWNEHMEALPYVWMKGRVWIGKLGMTHSSIVRDNPDLFDLLKQVTQDAPWRGDKLAEDYYFGRVFPDGEVVDWVYNDVPENVATDVRNHVTPAMWEYDEANEAFGKVASTIQNVEFEPTGFGGQREIYARPVIYNPSDDMVYIGPGSSSHAELLRNISEEWREMIEDDDHPGFGYLNDARQKHLGFGEVTVSPFTHRMDWDWYDGPTPDAMQNYVDAFNDDAQPVVPPLSFETGWKISAQPIELMYSDPYELEDYKYWLNGGYHNDPDRARLAWVWKDGTLFIGQNHSSIIRGMRQEGLDATKGAAFGWVDPTEDGTPWSMITDFGKQDPQAQAEVRQFFNTYGPDAVIEYARNGTPLRAQAGFKTAAIEDHTEEFGYASPSAPYFKFIYDGRTDTLHVWRTKDQDGDPWHSWVFKKLYNVTNQYKADDFAWGWGNPSEFGVYDYGNPELADRAAELISEYEPGAHRYSSSTAGVGDINWANNSWQGGWIYDPQTKKLYTGTFHAHILREHPELPPKMPDLILGHFAPEGATVESYDEEFYNDDETTNEEALKAANEWYAHNKPAYSKVATNVVDIPDEESHEYGWVDPTILSFYYFSPTDTVYIGSGGIHHSDILRWIINQGIVESSIIFFDMAHAGDVEAGLLYTSDGDVQPVWADLDENVVDTVHDWWAQHYTDGTKTSDYPGELAWIYVNSQVFVGNAHGELIQALRSDWNNRDFDWDDMAAGYIDGDNILVMWNNTPASDQELEQAVVNHLPRTSGWKLAYNVEQVEVDPGQKYEDGYPFMVFGDTVYVGEKGATHSGLLTALNKRNLFSTPTDAYTYGAIWEGASSPDYIKFDNDVPDESEIRALLKPWSEDIANDAGRYGNKIAATPNNYLPRGWEWYTSWIYIPKLDKLLISANQYTNHSALFKQNRDLWVDIQEGRMTIIPGLIVREYTSTNLPFGILPLYSDEFGGQDVIGEGEDKAIERVREWAAQNTNWGELILVMPEDEDINSYSKIATTVQYVPGEEGEEWDDERVPIVYDKRNDVIYYSDWGAFHRPILQYLNSRVEHGGELLTTDNLAAGEINSDGTFRWIWHNATLSDIAPEVARLTEQLVGEYNRNMESHTSAAMMRRWVIFDDTLYVNEGQDSSHAGMLRRLGLVRQGEEMPGADMYQGFGMIEPDGTISIYYNNSGMRAPELRKWIMQRMSKTAGYPTQDTMLHVAPASQRESILAHGLNYSKRETWMWQDKGFDYGTEQYPAGNYLFIYNEHAEDYVNNFPAGTLADIWAVNVEGLHLQGDPQFAASDDQDSEEIPDYLAYYTSDPIPPSRLSLTETVEAQPWDNVYGKTAGRNWFASWIWFNGHVEMGEPQVEGHLAIMRRLKEDYDINLYTAESPYIAGWVLTQNDEYYIDVGSDWEYEGNASYKEAAPDVVQYLHEFFEVPLDHIHVEGLSKTASIHVVDTDQGGMYLRVDESQMEMPEGQSGLSAFDDAGNLVGSVRYQITHDMLWVFWMKTIDQAAFYPLAQRLVEIARDNGLPIEASFTNPKLKALFDRWNSRHAGEHIASTVEYRDDPDPDEYIWTYSVPDDHFVIGNRKWYHTRYWQPGDCISGGVNSAGVWVYGAGGFQKEYAALAREKMEQLLHSGKTASDRMSKTAGTTMYHVAPQIARENILEYGLQPSDDYQPELYFFQHLYQAREFIENYRTKQPMDIWAVNLPTDIPMNVDEQSYPGMSDYDPEQFGALSPRPFYISYGIPPDRLQLLNSAGYSTDIGQNTQSCTNTYHPNPLATPRAPVRPGLRLLATVVVNVGLDANPRGSDASPGIPFMYNATDDIVYIGSLGTHHYQVTERIPELDWNKVWHEGVIKGKRIVWYKDWQDPPTNWRQINQAILNPAPIGSTGAYPHQTDPSRVPPGYEGEYKNSADDTSGVEDSTDNAYPFDAFIYDLESHNLYTGATHSTIYQTYMDQINTKARLIFGYNEDGVLFTESPWMTKYLDEIRAEIPNRHEASLNRSSANDITVHWFDNDSDDHHAILFDTLSRECFIAFNGHHRDIVSHYYDQLNQSDPIQAYEVNINGQVEKLDWLTGNPREEDIHADYTPEIQQAFDQAAKEYMASPNHLSAADTEVTWEQFNNRFDSTPDDFPKHMGLIYDATIDHLYTSRELNCSPYHPVMMSKSPELQETAKTNPGSLYFGTAVYRDDEWQWGWETLEESQGDKKNEERADELMNQTVVQIESHIRHSEQLELFSEPKAIHIPTKKMNDFTWRVPIMYDWENNTVYYGDADGWHADLLRGILRDSTYEHGQQAVEADPDKWSAGWIDPTGYWQGIRGDIKWFEYFRNSQPKPPPEVDQVLRNAVMKESHKEASIINLTGWPDIVSRVRAVAFASDGKDIYFGTSHPNIIRQLIPEEEMATQNHPMFDNTTWVFGWADRIGPDDPWRVEIVSGNFWAQNEKNRGYDEKIRRQVQQYLNTGQVQSHSNSLQYQFVPSSDSKLNSSRVPVIYDPLENKVYYGEEGGTHPDLFREAVGEAKHVVQPGVLKDQRKGDMLAGIYDPEEPSGLSWVWGDYTDPEAADTKAQIEAYLNQEFGGPRPYVNKLESHIAAMDWQVIDLGEAPTVFREGRYAWVADLISHKIYVGKGWYHGDIFRSLEFGESHEHMDSVVYSQDLAAGTFNGTRANWVYMGEDWTEDDIEEVQYELAAHFPEGHERDIPTHIGHYEAKDVSTHIGESVRNMLVQSGPGEPHVEMIHIDDDTHGNGVPWIWLSKTDTVYVATGDTWHYKLAALLNLQRELPKDEYEMGRIDADGFVTFYDFSGMSYIYPTDANQMPPNLERIGEVLYGMAHPKVSSFIQTVDATPDLYHGDPTATPDDLIWVWVPQLDLIIYAEGEAVHTDLFDWAKEHLRGIPDDAHAGYIMMGDHHELTSNLVEFPPEVQAKIEEIRNQIRHTATTVEEIPAVEEDDIYAPVPRKPFIYVPQEDKIYIGPYGSHHHQLIWKVFQMSDPNLDPDKEQIAMSVEEDAGNLGIILDDNKQILYWAEPHQEAVDEMAQIYPRYTQRVYDWDNDDFLYDPNKPIMMGKISPMIETLNIVQQ